jgi:hypothetical protein
MQRKQLHRQPNECRNIPEVVTLVDSYFSKASTRYLILHHIAVDLSPQPHTPSESDFIDLLPLSRLPMSDLFTVFRSHCMSSSSQLVIRSKWCQMQRG